MLELSDVCDVPSFDDNYIDINELVEDHGEEPWFDYMY